MAGSGTSGTTIDGMTAGHAGISSIAMSTPVHEA
jgi:hypothetical protein